MVASLISNIITFILILIVVIMIAISHLAEDSFYFLMVGHHVNEEVDSNLKCHIFVNQIVSSVQHKIMGFYPQFLQHSPW